MEKICFSLLIALMLSSCSDKNEPTAVINSLVSEISNGSSNIERITYDELGRVVKYDISYTDGTVSCTYSYPSENNIVIHTKEMISVWDYYKVREYDDELILDNGRALYCDGIYTEYETKNYMDELVTSKKYRQDFTYTDDNHLRVIKNTQWSKRGDGWALDRPWTWENYHIWEDGNLVEIEDYNGSSKPAFTYKYTYSPISGVKNVLKIHHDRYSYFPLQLNGIFGRQSENLVIGMKMSQFGVESYNSAFEYDIVDDKILSYIETRGEKTYDFKVTWIQ